MRGFSTALETVKKHCTVLEAEFEPVSYFALVCNALDRKPEEKYKESGSTSLQKFPECTLSSGSSRIQPPIKRREAQDFSQKGFFKTAQQEKRNFRGRIISIIARDATLQVYCSDEYMCVQYVTYRLYLRVSNIPEMLPLSLLPLRCLPLGTM